MTTFLAEALFFLIGIALGAWWFSVTVLPLFYGLPKSFYWSLRGLFSWRFPFSYLVPPLIWNLAFVGLVVALYIWLPSVHSRMSEGPGFARGWLLGIVGSLWYAFTRDGKKTLRLDFQMRAMEFVKSPELLEEYSHRNETIVSTRR